MLQEDKQILWRASAAMIGMAMPMMVLGKGVMFSLLLLGMVLGLMATKDESLRVTVRLLLDSWVTLVVVVLLGALLAGVMTGINPAYSFERWTHVVLEAVCAGLMFITLREMPGRHVELLMKVLAAGTMAAAALGVLDALIGDPRLSAALHGADKALTPYRLNFLSSDLAVLLPFVWARLMLKAREGEPFAVRINEPVVAFGLMAVMICGGRSGWAGLLVGIAVFMLMAGRYHGLVLHARQWLGGLLALMAGVALYAVAFGWTFAWDRVSIVGEQGVGRGMLSGRLEVWHSALVHVLDKPVFGVGVMNFRNLPGSVDLHPHNWLLQIFLEGGAVSTVIYLGLLGLLLVRFTRYAKGNLYGVAALASLSAFLVAGLANTSIFNLSWLTFFSLLCLLGWRAGWGGEDLKRRRRRPTVVKASSGLEP